ncbi:MAG: nucleoside 2-deoxyribosyltransferase [Gaiellaceae bacterium]
MRIYFAGPLFTPYERSFIEECAARLRDEEFEVFVPHEHALAAIPEVEPASIFEQDWPGIESAHAVLALLDGPTVDDGVACEIGLFHALARAEPWRHGVVGLLTDMRGTRRGSFDVNPFVRGCIEETGGEIVASLDAAIAVLAAWRATM